MYKLPERRGGGGGGNLGNARKKTFIFKGGLLFPYHLVCAHGLHTILYGASPHLNGLTSCVLPPCVPPRGTVQCTCYHLVCMHGLPSSCILPHHGACMQLRIIVKSHMYAFEKCYFPLGFFPERSYCIFIYALHIRDMIFSFSKAGSDVSITNLRLDACSSNE